jgi:threonine dehydrogenase-like Zn-dependent dehydrogenase
VKRSNRHLRNLIHAGKARPSFIVSHHLSLHRAPEGYAHFNSRDDGWTEVLLHPNGTS